MFSLLTQFTYKSYGTDTSGSFKIVDVPEVSRAFIGDDVPSKILFGTITWIFHLVSDVAGSSSSVGKSGGTGIPGPMLALAKNFLSCQFSKYECRENSLSVFLSSYSTVLCLQSTTRTVRLSKKQFSSLTCVVNWALASNLEDRQFRW
jgi:hypothetical protein